ncbi:MAG: sodium:solute symporter family protein [Planctomycetes bacterium]|nr:sodium:solute symporter family protein [Planctomycetota bacterium]
MSLTLVGVLLYVVAQLAIGFVVSKRVKNEEDYLVAGRQLGPWVAGFSIFATWFGAETCVGAAGRAYENGVSANTSDPFGYGFAVLITGALFATVLWKRKLTTIADLYRSRYSPGVERLAAIVLIPSSLFWAAAQIHAFGQVLASVSELDADLAITIAAAVVIVYTTSGGMWADAVTDVVQGVALVIGLVAMAIAVVWQFGGVSDAVASIDPERLALASSVQEPWTVVLERWALPIGASIFAQELIGRISASRSARIARNATLAAGGAYLVIGLVPVFLGLVGAKLIPGLESSEQILPRLAHDRLGPVIFVLFAGALVSAILSTVDSCLLVASSLASHNVIAPLNPSMSEAAKVRLARIGVVVFGIVAYVLALHAGSVYEMVESSSAIGSSGAFVVTLFALTSRFGGPVAAYAALIVGTLVYLVGPSLGVGDWPYLASLVGALAAYVVCGFVERASTARVAERSTSGD